MIQEFESTKHELRKALSDIRIQRDAHQRLQQKLQELGRLEEHTKVLIDRKPYVVVLLDADGYVFKDDFLGHGEAGGEKAADELLVGVRKHLDQNVEELANADIVVRAYANVEGLSNALIRDGKLKSVAEFRAFVAGFTSRQPFFDFVDVGAGKERADCYAPFLGRFAGDRAKFERICLLEADILSPSIKSLGFKDTDQFSNVFATSRNVVKGATAASPPPQFKNKKVQVLRLGPVLLNAAGKRYDRPLSVRPELIKELKGANPCPWLYLRGECLWAATFFLSNPFYF
ncbi:hypothetical protein H2201_005896 [Coniosporium apollinis]|uniref:DUF7923 domain-containing protein n=1 Tax=Coniosporium apollinis TaxID=61459 RepID=A0ABQ9NTQ3_9PEZI|nr:hypothetical protein H2201_005896 [Coniosporium apollinis]